MADNNQPTEWYLARDGQQHGPVTDAELKKIIELGYLRPTDLVWRQGMAEWAAAESVLDLRSAAARPAPAPPSPSPSHAGIKAKEAGVAAQPQQPGPARSEQHRGYSAPSQGAARTAEAALAAHRGTHAESDRQSYASSSQPARDATPAPIRPSRGGYDGGEAEAFDDRRRRGFPWRAVSALFLIGILGAGGWGLYATGKLAHLPFLAAPATSNEVPIVNRPTGSARDATTQSGASVSSSTDTANLPQPIEQRLQSSPLWKVLQQNFPEWYSERVAEIAKLSSESKSQREIDAALTRAIVELRRRHQSDALAASPARLKAMASAFVESLGRLAKISTPACYGYISQGEASPAIADLTSPEQRTAIDAQLATIFDAIAEGRQSPSQRDQPKREDYDVLSKELGQRGWSAADLQLFTDARALSRAAPEKVCQMVQDWFAAQLAVPDEAVKIRLLGEALRPVVAG
ncbi:MAG: DUF4339 domain-containing protein [Hyphomicrobiaceae bacterium]